jgi:hypothetical protein
VTRCGIGHDLDYGVIAGDLERLRNAVITLLDDRASGSLIAFNALSYMKIELRGRPACVLRLGRVTVDTGYRTQGLSWVLYGLTCMLTFVKRGLPPVWISNVTQMPAIIGKVAESSASAIGIKFHRRRVRTNGSLDARDGRGDICC